jgi:tRNA threonylcarbamoyladenosine biosynthesis protein TsaB
MSNPIVLGIETSGILCSVAWWQNDAILLEYNLERKNEHAVLLAVFVEKGFKKLGINPAETSYVALGSGPGSFTGLRIGMSYAKGFCYGHDIPLISVTNFEMLADLSEENVYPVYTLIEAGKGNYYTGIFKEDKTRLDEKNVYSVSQLEEKISDTGIIVVHEENSQGYLTQVFEKAIRIIDGQYSAAKLCSLGYHKLLRGEMNDISDIEPFYLQAFAGIP